MVTIAFGINDWKGSDTFGTFDDDITTGGAVYSNMRYVIEKILTDNPECKIFIITPINASKYAFPLWGVDNSCHDCNNR